MISVIIPTYNRAHLIAETLDSVIAQTYKDWECIIIDDYSTDDTDKIIEGYLLKDKRFSYYKKPKYLLKGPSASRNFGLKKAKGDYVNWLDSDDLLHPQKMEIDLKLINSGDYDFTISQSKFFTDDGSPPKKEFWNNNLWSEDPINDFIMLKTGWSTNAPLWKCKSLIKYSLFFDEKLFTAEDYIYHIEALAKGLKPTVSRVIMINQREHNGRLDGYNLKAPFKIIVNNYVLKNYFYVLNKSSIDFLNFQTYKQLTNLLKKKKIILYLKYLATFIFLNYKCITKLRSISKLPFGLFYLFTNKGYKFLN